MDFIIKLFKSKNWQRVKYNSIIVIGDRLIKIVYYLLLLTLLVIKQLFKILIEIFFKYYNLLNFIIIN